MSRAESESRPRPPSRSGSVTLLSFGHAGVDIYQGAVAALVPFFVSERAYSYAAASAVVLAASLLSSVVQPLFGVLTDKWAMPWLLPVSTLAGGAGVALAGVSGSYGVTLTVVAVSGIGVAAYHPEAARVARLVSGGSHSAMGWYSLGGNLGFAAAPFLVWGVMAVGGLRASPLLIVPALAGAALTLAALRGVKARATATGSTRAGDVIGQDDWASFLKLSGAVVCRSIVFVGLSAFISLYVRQRAGGGDVSGTVALVVLYLGGAVGTVAGGKLATRYGRVPVVQWSYALTVPAVAGVVLVPGPLLYGCIALTSAGLYLPFSLHITLGQDYLPRRVGTASGVTLGLTVSIGGIATPLIGAAADATSLQTALAPLIALPALGWLLLRTLAEPTTLETATHDGAVNDQATHAGSTHAGSTHDRTGTGPDAHPPTPATPANAPDTPTITPAAPTDAPTKTTPRAPRK
ncbi:MFS transporter [Streptomyces sp. NPDC091292]|uniref:MFS transporter n=1 Tax=Streptomyces sp. NPDC091292 TaxID=3365991 RepID=UPI003815B986